MPDELTAGMRLVPANFGPLKGAQAHAGFTGPCGDTMEFWLQFHEGRISRATYTSDGCWHSVISGSAAATLALGRGPEELNALTQDDVFAEVGVLPPDHRHCCRLAAKTLKLAAAEFWGFAAIKVSRDILPLENTGTTAGEAGVGTGITNTEE